MTGLRHDDEDGLNRLIDDYGLGEIEPVRPLLREVTRRRFGSLGLRIIENINIFWRPYDLWNAALAEPVFTREHAGRSVYLDMEPEVLQQVASLIWPPIDPEAVDVEASFCQTERWTCLAPGQFGRRLV